MNARDDLRDCFLSDSRDRFEAAADAYRAEVIAERDAEIVAWLIKKAREFRSTGSKQHALQADAVAAMASKIARDAVRANNMLGAPTRAEVLRRMADAAASAQPTCSQCPTPAQPGTPYCSTACRNLDDPHDNGEATDGEVPA